MKHKPKGYKKKSKTKNKPKGYKKWIRDQKQKTDSNKIKIITLLQQCKINEKYSKINMNSYNFYKWKYQS